MAPLKRRRHQSGRTTNVPPPTRRRQRPFSASKPAAANVAAALPTRRTADVPHRRIAAPPTGCTPYRKTFLDIQEIWQKILGSAEILGS